jgi:aminoglycoside phosphotransferase (APT) family kinase protein
MKVLSQLQGDASASTRDQQARLLAHALREAGVLGSHDLVRDVTQLSGGWSRHSFVAGAVLATGGERRFIVRVEAPGGVLDSDIAAEYALYHALDNEPGIRTPSVYHFDGSTDNAFGNRFMVMEHVPGRAANAFRKGDRAWLEADWNGPRGIATDMVENLARLHCLPVERLPPGTVPQLSFLDVVRRWQSVYEERHLVRDPVTEEGFRWLRARVPADGPRGIVHGDYRIGNGLVEHGRLTAMLDWELAYVGDVRFDLGYLALERLAGKHLRPVTSLLNAFADADWFFAEYARRTGRPVDLEVVRTFSVLGIMMLLSTHYMGIWMYSQGRSADFRLAWNRFGAIGLRQDLTTLMRW